MNAIPVAGSGTAGVLSRCVHPGSFPQSSKPGGTTVGTNDPAIWQYLMWFDGQFWAMEMHHDVRLGEPCSFSELKGHFEYWQAAGENPWRRVYPEALRGKEAV